MPQPDLSITALPFDEAISWALARGVVLPDEFYARLQDAAVRNRFTLTGLAELDQIAAVKRSLDTALAEGKTLAQWSQSVDVAKLALSPARKDLIFRMALQNSYSAGRWKQVQANKNRRPYLMYDAINDSRTRPSHLAMDGYIAPVGDSIWQRWTPPAGFNCRCALVAVTEKQAIARGYSGTPAPAPAEPDPGFAYNPGADYERMLSGLEASTRMSVSHTLQDAYDARRARDDENVPIAVAEAGGVNAALFRRFAKDDLTDLRKAKAAALTKAEELRTRIAAPRAHAFPGATESQIDALRTIIWPRDAEAFTDQAQFIELLLTLKEGFTNG